MWYREGTITFTQGSNTLVGAGTAWNVTANGVLPGMIVIGPDNKLYEIKRVISDTNIVLSEPYTGETQSEVPCRIITTYEGDLTQFSARFTALMSRMSADSKSMRSWLTALDEVTIEREDGTEVAVKPLMQIVNEHNENVEWYKNNTDAIDAAGDKAREAAASAAAAAESANTAGEKASQASQSASAAASSQSAASASATAAKKSETNAAASQQSAATSASTATTKASEAATSARDAAASKEAAKSSETNASLSASSAASSATAAGNSANAAKTSETNARSSETAAGQSASAAAGSKTAAASSASAASTSAGQASASATAAGKSAESAASSASTATTKAGEATEQASAAARSASAAKTSETNAKASETSAESSKTAAASSASSAASSASSASASKDEATRQASAAKGSATTASTKATEAAGSATAASQSKTAAESAATRAEAAAERAEEIADAIGLEDASLTTKGIVRLSNDTNSTAENLAATPKAVKTVMDVANTKAPSSSPVLTGVPTAPTPAPEVNNNQIATTQFVHQIISALIGDAPDALNTLKELSDALGGDPNFATTITTLINSKLAKDQNGADIPNKQLFIDNVGLRETVNLALGALQKNQNGADIPDKGRFLSNINAASRTDMAAKKGMKYSTVDAPAGVEAGKFYPVVIRRSTGFAAELASRVTISTSSRTGSHRLNNCEFNGFVMPGGWTDRGKYAYGMFHAYTASERAIHSIMMGNKADDLCSVFYVEGEAFPIAVYVEEGLSVVVPSADYVIGQTTYKWGATNPKTECIEADTILDFSNGRGFYSSHALLTNADISGNRICANGEIVARGENQIRMIGGDYGAFWRNDGRRTYLLFTAKGDQYGGWNDLRPIMIDNATGEFTIETKLNAGQGVNGNASSATKLQTPRYFNDKPFDGTGNVEITRIETKGRVTALQGATQGSGVGIEMYEVYNNGYPTTYGNTIHLKGRTSIGEGEILVGWSGTSGAHAPVYVRSRRDTDSAPWSEWAQFYTTAHKPTAKDVGAAQTFSASYSTGAGNWTTAEFIAWLKERGAFAVPYWMMKGSWSYADNKIITDTGVGNICLAGAVIEVLGHEGAMTIRVTTPTTTTGGGIASAQFTYINHGSAYAPAWRRDYNTTLKPTAADVGALPISGGTMNGVLTLQNVSQPLKTQGGGILANDGNLYINKSGFAGWIDALFMKNSGGTMSGQLKIRSTDGLRIYDAAYGMIFRRSENNFYLIPTAKDQGENGGIGSLRPFYVDLTNGRVTMGNGAVVNGGLGLGVVNGLGGNSIVLGDNDTGFKQNGDGILDVYANSAHVFRFVNSTLQSLKPLSVTGDIASSAWVYANRFSINSGSGAWIDMRNQNVIFGGNAVSTNSAQALLRQDHADRKFFLGGLGNSQFGFYMINNSRTANGTDANAYLQNDGTWVCGGNGNFNDVYIRSDRRSKRNIRKIERALDKLEQIEGVLYEIQVCDRYEQSGGLIAQDVQNVQPELVTVDHNDQSGEPRLRLNYNGVIGMLVEAVKELREEVRELKAKM